MLCGLSPVCATPPAAADEPGLLRIAHLSPDTPAVDVSVRPVGAAPATTVGGVGYGAVSGWQQLAPGSYAIALRRAGSPASTPPSLSTAVEVRAGAAQTVAAVGRFADVRLQVLPEDLTPPAAGHARVRVVDAATAGPLDVGVTGGARLAAGLQFPATSAWSEVPAGPTALRVAVSTTAADDVPVDLAAGSVTTLLVLDRLGGGLTVRPVLDAGGTAVMPAGSVQAGGGGTAGGPPYAALGLAAAAALLVGVRALRRLVPVVVLAAGALAAPGSTSPSPPAPVATPVVVAAAADRAAAPVRLQVPAAGVDTAPAAIGVDGSGALVPPEDVTTAGWFAQGAAPGDAGPAVLAGHVDSVAGPGVFFRLRSLVPGDPVLVTRADGSVVRFTVTRVARYPKTAFPTAEVYGPTADAELRLVTCGGAFDRAARSYVDDVVVYARSG